MTVEITLKGTINPVRVDGNYHETVQGMNQAAAQGMKFMLAETPSGNNIAVSLEDIITVEEEELDANAGFN